MGTIQPIITNNKTPQELISWEALTEADTAIAADFSGGIGFISVYGTFGGATVTIQISVDGGVTYITPDADNAPNGCVFISNGVCQFDFPRCKIKPIASGGSSQDVDIKISPKVYR